MRENHKPRDVPDSQATSRLAATLSAFAGLVRDRSGQTLTLFALSLVPLTGIIGLSIDGAQWMMWKREMHTSADLAALAGARAIADSHVVETAVRKALSNNATRTFTIDSIQSPPTSGSQVGNDKAVRVELSVAQKLPFSSLFLSAQPRVKVIATAVSTIEVANCVVTLESTETTALSVSGSASVRMNCGMSSNAIGANSLVADGELVDVAALSAVGSVVQGTSITSQTKINEGITPVADPYAGKLAIPDLSSMCSGASAVSVRSMQSQTISPGCYTSLKSLGSLTLQPGTYYIDGGDVTVGSQSLIKGDGVTLVFTNSDPNAAGNQIGRFTAAGSSYIQLKAPTTGLYAGVVMHQDPRAIPSNGTNFFITGNSGSGLTSYLQGAVYTPSTYTTFSGNSGLSTPCMQIVSRRVTFTGNTSVTNNCPAGSGASSFGGGGRAKLVE